MRTLHSAQMTFAAGCGGGGYAASLADLGLAPAGQSPYIPTDLAQASPGGTPKSGYEFTVTGTGTTVVDASKTCNGSSGDLTTTFFIQGDPTVPGSSGVRFFATDTTGEIRVGTSQLPDMSSGIPLQ